MALRAQLVLKPDKGGSAGAAVPQADVLLVEDDPLVRLFVAEVLTDAGFKIVETANAAEALMVLKAGHHAKVLLTDVEMPPGITGFELAHLVAARWPDMALLIVSGRRYPAPEELPSGAVFLMKPVYPDRLLQHVHEAVARAAAQRATGGG